MQLNKNQECMHDREFEKQVQQKMQELRFQPGADVWARVQADVQKKRRRRPVLLWILFAGLMIGSAWILYSNLGNKQSKTAGQVPSSETNTTSVTKQSDNSTTADINGRSDNATPEKTNSNASDNSVADKNVTPKKTSTPAEKRDVARIVKPGHQQATEKPAGHKQSGRQPVESVIAKNDPLVATGKPKKGNGSPDVAKTDKSKSDVTKTDIVKTDATDKSKSDLAKTDVIEANVAKAAIPKLDIANTDIPKTDITKVDVANIKLP